VSDLADWGVELTLERAEQVKRWRTTDEDLTWRGTAYVAAAVWGCHDYASNQLFGKDLVEASARMLGEEGEDWA